jgi:hypothetical protein
VCYADGNDLFGEDAGISSRSDLFGEILRDEAVARLKELGKVTETQATTSAFDIYCEK